MTQTLPPQFQLGTTALREGRLSDAETHFEACLQSQPENPAVLYNLGVSYFQQGKSSEAEKCLAQANAVRPDHSDTQAILAAVLIDQNKPDEAVPLARALSTSESSDASTLNTAGQVLAAAGSSDEAVHAYEKALRLEKGYRPAASALVTLLLARRSFARAVEVCDASLLHHLTDQNLHLKRAQALWEDGQISRARSALHNLLGFAPDHITAHYNLSLFDDPADADSSIRRLSVLVTEDDLAPDDSAKAWFALGNLNAVCADYESALGCFAEGNAVRAAWATAAHTLSADAFDKRVEYLTSRPLPPYRPGEASHPSQPTPLIITGPSRSGKSLLQAWLSGHPDISAADETGVLPRLAEEDVLSNESRRAEAAAAYRETLARLGGDTRFVIDTHPVNALYLDLLHALCPDAVVVQVDRNPLDLAVSIFARNFVNGGHWADTWCGIAARLKAHRQLDTYWAPWGAIKSKVNYESLIRDPGRMLRSVIEKLDLPWTGSVLPPADAQPDERLQSMPWASFPNRPVVRADTIDLWKPFAPWLAEFANAYGRDSLNDAGLIPNTEVEPISDLAATARALHAGGGSPELIPDVMQALPAVQARWADDFERKSHWGEALSRRFKAVDGRPFTYRVRHHAEALRSTLARSPDHGALSALHADIEDLWQNYRTSEGLHFGDYGLLYQSYASLYLAGSRNTEERCQAYGLDGLVKGRRVLDLGCNTGFLTLRAAETASCAVGVESQASLIDIGRRVAQFLKVSNCTFHVDNAAQFQSDESFDVVIAAALHGWLDMPFAAFVTQACDLTASGGAVLFESQGRRSTTQIEEGFDDKVEIFKRSGFEVERDGTVCDDGANLRAFVVLRKQH